MQAGRNVILTLLGGLQASKHSEAGVNTTRQDLAASCSSSSAATAQGGVGHIQNIAAIPGPAGSRWSRTRFQRLTAGEGRPLEAQPSWRDTVDKV